MILQLALIGVLIALLPLSYVWVRGGEKQSGQAGARRRYRLLASITLFLTLDLIMFGGFTRLTDSGLGCPDWPGCYGASNPFHALDDIRAAEMARPSGPVTVMKAWIEMLHRYFAMAVGVLIIALVILAWRQWTQSRKSFAPPRQIETPWFATALLVLVCVQGAFGAWTVTLKLQPLIVTTHLLLAMTLLAGLTWLVARHQPQPLRVAPVPANLRQAVLIGLTLLVMQIALGGWVSTNYAVLACTDFPQCNGAWLPPMDFEHGFTLWRQLGKTGGGDHITHAALVAIHWTHRTFAVIVVAYLAWLGWRTRREQGLHRWSLWLLGLLLLQVLTGLSNIVLHWPLPAAIAHNGGSAALLLVLIRLNYNTWFFSRDTLPQASTASPSPLA